MDDAPGFVLDDEVRDRLGRRYGSAVGSWFDGLPERLASLARRWRLELGPVVRRGSVSVVVTCTAEDGAPAVLKVSPDTARIDAEGQALAAWRTRHVPRVLASDPDEGALLLEAIRPGVALDESTALPTTEATAALITALHGTGPPRASVSPLRERVTALFDAGQANYARRPELVDVVPLAAYAAGRRAAIALATDAGPDPVVLHGDLTPANVLDGGASRGLVAVDPAPCCGDPAFDTVDLLMWQVDGLAALGTRAEELAALVGLPARRLLRWCAAFAAMNALELAEGVARDRPLPDRVGMLLELSRAS